MPTTRITDATVEPLTIAQAKRHLAIDDTGDAVFDAAMAEDIAAALKAARHTCEHRLQHTLIDSTWLHTRDAFACWTMPLAMGAVSAIDWVKYIDGNGALQTLATDQYKLDADRLTPAYGCAWPTTRCESGAVRIQYTAGFGPTAATVPPNVVAWIKLCLTDLWEQRARSAERPVVPHDFADALLNSCREWLL